MDFSPSNVACFPLPTSAELLPTDPKDTYAGTVLRNTRLGRYTKDPRTGIRCPDTGGSSTCLLEPAGVVPAALLGGGGGGIMDWAAWPKLQLGNGLFEDGELGRGYVRLNKDASRLLREFPEPLMSGLVYC